LKELGITNEADIVIFGHSHKDYINTTDKPYLFNPGSITLPRNSLMQKSYGIIEIANQEIDFQIKYIKNLK
jgi:putative phosphoesterase